jgi:hypothetical protein
VTDAERQELKDRILMAELANKTADTALKNEQRTWEPVKAMAAAFGAGLAVATALIGGIAWVLSRIIH